MKKEEERKEEETTAAKYNGLRYWAATAINFKNCSYEWVSLCSVYSCHRHKLHNKSIKQF